MDAYHPALVANLNLSRFKFMLEKRQTKVNFHKADYVALNRELMMVPWHSLLGDLNVDEAVEKFYSVVQPFVDRIPKVYFPTRDYPVFYSYELIGLIKEKDKVRLMIKEADCPMFKAELRHQFSGLRKLVKLGIKTCFDDYVRDCEEKLKSNTKCFFAFTKSLRKTNSLPTGMKYLGEESFRQSVCVLRGILVLCLTQWLSLPLIMSVTHL